MTVKAVGTKRVIDETARLAKNAAISASQKATKERRKRQTCKVFDLKIQTNRLSTNQKEALRLVFLEAKWLRNAIIGSESIAGYKIGPTVTVKTPDGFQERDFRYLGSQMKQSVQTEVINNTRSLHALKGKGKKVGRLKFTDKVTSIDLKQYKGTYRFTSATKAKIQNIPGRVTVKGLHQLDGWEPANAKLVNRPDGYHLVVTAYKDKENIEDLYRSGTELGIDMGLKTHFTLSNRQEVSATFEEPERLKRLQRRVARKEKGSNGRRKERLLLEREYQKLGNRKNDAANKLVRQFLANEKVVIQDEQIATWKRRDGYVRGGRNVHHSILGRVKTRLARHHRVTVLPKSTATTKTCVCGVRTPHTVAQRVFVCGSCWFTEDRDVHAARNMVRFAIPPEQRESTPVEMESDWISGTVPIQHPSLKREASTSSAST